MSEFPSSLPDIFDIRWNTGPGAEMKTEPAEGEKDTGWAYKDKVPYEILNWLWNKYYEFLDWIFDQVPREFSSVKEGIDESADLALFRVRQTVSNASLRCAHKVFTDTQGTGGAVSISCMCICGRRIYYAQGANVYAADPEDGSNLWSHTTNSLTVNCIYTDGYRVYVGRDTGTGAEIEALDPSDGTVKATVESASSIAALAANGVKLVVAYGSNIEVFSIAATSLTSDGTYGHGATVVAVAVDDRHAYIGGSRGTGNFDLRAISLSTRTAQWSVALPTTATPTINGIATDGEVVYAVTDDVTTSGGSASLFAHGTINGEAIWDGLSGDDNYRVYVDDHYIVTVRDDGVSKLLCRRDHHTIRLIGAGTMQECWGLDPVGTIVTNGGYDFNRIYLGYATRLCQKADLTDIKRRPYFGLAIPIAGG